MLTATATRQVTHDIIRQLEIDMERARKFVVDEMTHLFNDEHSVLDDTPLDENQIGALLGGLIGQYMQVRKQTISSLMAQIVEARRILELDLRRRD